MAADTPPQVPHGPEPVVLEHDVPLSQSLIWRLQREFYIQRGLRAWIEDLVPNFLTNNPFIAEIYARIVFEFLRECIESGSKEFPSPDKPLRILELGAGPGKFAYLFLRNLTALLRTKNLSPHIVRYCITDCSESVVESWRSNSYLAEFADDGILAFELLQAGEQVKSTPVKGPLVVIANYVFDSLPQDAFVIQEGKISEALVTTAKPSRAGDDSTPVQLKTLERSYNNVSVPADRYSDESWNNILDHYRSHLPSATVLFPCAALKTIQELSKSSDGRMLVLAADKGHAHEEDLLLVQGPPAFEFHAANCFSQMVNFDAIGKYFNAIGGEGLVPGKHAASLNICAFLRGQPGDQFPATKAAYRAALDAFGPDDLFTLLAWLNAHMEEMTVPQILAALRLTHWDPVALLRLFPVLARQVRAVNAARLDVKNAVLRTWANHYPVHPSENVIAFDCGVILLELRFFDEALSMFKASQRIFGPSATTSYNLGLCALGLKRAPEALAFMVEACELDPNFEPARLSRRKLEYEASQH